jgi:hypothetical protein
MIGKTQEPKELLEKHMHGQLLKFTEQITKFLYVQSKKRKIGNANGGHLLHPRHFLSSVSRGTQNRILGEVYFQLCLAPHVYKFKCHIIIFIGKVAFF